MNHKGNSLNAIKQSVIAPHIIFAAAYMLLGANVAMCTSKRESRLRNLSSAHNQVNASNRLKDLNRLKGDALGVKSRLGRGTLDQEQCGEPFATTTVVLPEQPVGKNRTIASSSTNISGSVPPLSSANISASGGSSSTNTSASGSPLSSANTSASGSPPPPIPTKEQLKQAYQQQNLNATAHLPNQGGNDPGWSHPIDDGSKKEKLLNGQQHQVGLGFDADMLKLAGQRLRKTEYLCRNDRQDQCKSKDRTEQNQDLDQLSLSTALRQILAPIRKAYSNDDSDSDNSDNEDDKYEANNTSMHQQASEATSVDNEVRQVVPEDHKNRMAKVIGAINEKGKERNRNGLIDVEKKIKEYAFKPIASKSVGKDSCNPEDSNKKNQKPDQSNNVIAILTSKSIREKIKLHNDADDEDTGVPDGAEEDDEW